MPTKIRFVFTLQEIWYFYLEFIWGHPADPTGSK